MLFMTQTEDDFFIITGARDVFSTDRSLFTTFDYLIRYSQLYESWLEIMK